MTPNGAVKPSITYDPKDNRVKVSIGSLGGWVRKDITSSLDEQANDKKNAIVKRKLDTPIGADNEIHHHDTFNFSHPRVAQRTIRSHVSPLPIIVEEIFASVFEVPPPPSIDLYFCRITIVQ